jgi:hypothetical protein
MDNFLLTEGLLTSQKETCFINQLITIRSLQVYDSQTSVVPSITYLFPQSLRRKSSQYKNEVFVLVS